MTAQAGVAFKASSGGPSPRGEAAQGFVGVAGVVVTVEGTALSATTDASGFFSIAGVPQGFHILVCTATAADGTVYSFLRVVDVQVGQVLTLGDIPLKPTGKIRGRATLDTQTDPTGISVFIPGTSFVAKTDGLGDYLLDNVSEGTHDLRFEKAGFLPAKLTGLTVVSGVTTPAPDVVLNVSTGTSGSILLEDGKAYTNSRTVMAAIAVSSSAVLMQLSEDPNFVNAVWQPIASAKTWVFASDGAHRLYVKFSDDNGLESAPVFDSIVVDTVPPADGSIAINGGASAANASAATLALASSDATTPVAQMRISEDASFAGIAWEPYAVTRAWALSAGDGVKTVYAKFMDAAGNESSQAVSASITLDTTPPDTGFASTPPDPAALSSGAAALTFAFSSTEGGSTFQMQLDGGGFADSANPLTLAGPAFGAHTIDIRSIDVAGNIDPTPAGYTWTYADDVPPAAPVLTGTTPTSPALNPTPGVNGAAEAGSVVRIYTSADGSGQAIGTGTADAAGDFAVPVTVGARASTTLYATSTDAAGNVSPVSTGITYVSDTAADVIAASVPGGTLGGCVPITYTVRQDGSSPATVTVEYDAGDGTFVPATPTSDTMATGVSTSPVGEVHSFVWNSGRDFLQTNATGIQLRVSATYLGTIGQTVTLTGLSLSNALSFGSRGAFPVPAGGGYQGLVIGDVNRDGNLDVVTANPDVNSISVLLGSGDGSLGAKTDFATGSSPRGPALGDLNGDGTLDLVVANAIGSSVSVLLGDGAGGFGAKTDFSVAGLPRSIGIADVNRDGNLDVVTSGIGGPGDIVSVLIGSGNGALGAGVDFTTGREPEGMAIADLNGDGILDIATANTLGQSVSILLGIGDGTFAAKQDYVADFRPRALAIDDLDGDGKPDIVVDDEPSARVSVLLGNGDGTVRARMNFAVGTGVQPAVVIGDLNLDGIPDIGMVSRISNAVVILPGSGDGSFASPLYFSTATAGTELWDLSIGDLNADGKPDLAVVKSDASAVSVLLNTMPDRCDPAFNAFAPVVTGEGAVDVAISDVNGDGKPDVVAANGDVSAIGGVSILPGDGQGSFGTAMHLQAATSSTGVGIGDLNRDGKADLAVASRLGGRVSVLLATGDGQFGSPTDYATGGESGKVAIGDLDLDGQPDLVVTSLAGVVVMLGAGSGTFDLPTVYPTSQPVLNNGASFPLADVNRDGRPDVIAVSGNSPSAVDVFLGNGSGGLGAGTAFPAINDSHDVAIGDLNRDGKADLAVASGLTGSGAVSVFMGNGDGSFGSRTDYMASGAVYSIAVGDVNGDGIPDVVAGVQLLTSRGLWILSGTGDGTLQAMSTLFPGFNILPTSVKLFDLNSDGLLDIIAGNGNNDTDSSSYPAVFVSLGR